MKKHLIRLFTVSAVVSLIAAFLLSMPLVQRYNLHQTQTQLKSILLILSAQGESLLENPDDFSDRCAGALSGSGLDIRITILGPDGRVVADSGPDSTLGQIHSDRPEVQKARSEGWGFHTRKSESTSILYSYAAYASNGIVYRGGHAAGERLALCTAAGFVCLHWPCGGDCHCIPPLPHLGGAFCQACI